jgi:hypothetical protein
LSGRPQRPGNCLSSCTAAVCQSGAASRAGGGCESTSSSRRSNATNGRYSARANDPHPLKQARLTFVAELERLDRLPREFAEAGLLFEARLHRLTDLAPLLGRRDQTLVAHGFEREELVALVDASAGRGLDRIVPLGTALRFSHRWDGMDLLEVLTRGVVLDAMG